MSSQERNTRGGGNGLDVRTLAIASFAAAAAAVIVSRVWTAGTPIAAAATPVIVTILKELLDRPTAAIADRVTNESAAVRSTRVWDTPTRGEKDPAAGSQEVTPPSEHRPGDVRVYQQKSAAPRRINPKVVAVTAVVAFVIAGVVITGGQVLAGNPFGKDGTGSIFLGEHKVGSKKRTTTTETEPQQTETVTSPTETVTEPQQTTTQPQDDQDQRTATERQQQQRNLQRQQTTTTPATPTETTPAP